MKLKSNFKSDLKYQLMCFKSFAIVFIALMLTMGLFWLTFEMDLNHKTTVIIIGQIIQLVITVYGIVLLYKDKRILEGAKKNFSKTSFLSSIRIDTIVLAIVSNGLSLFISVGSILSFYDIWL